MKRNMGCRGCIGLKDKESCECVAARQKNIEELDQEILQLESLKQWVRHLENAIEILESMTNTSITLVIDDLEDC